MLEITAKGRARLREAIPLWEKAQKTLHRKLGDRSWDLIRKNLDDLIRAA
jgi:DNA-binding MarR family transcriptional regulator